MSSHRYSLPGRVLRFILVGGLTAAVHIGLLVLAVELFSMGSTVSSNLGFAAAVVFNYLMHYQWTFATVAEVQQLPRGRSLARYVVMIVCGFSINMSVMHIGVSYLQWHYLLTQVIAVVLVVSWNFTLANAWVFRVEEN